MKCPSFGDLSAYIDGTAPEAVRSHVDECASCAQTLELASSADRYLRDMAVISASEKADEKVPSAALARIHRLVPQSKAGSPWKRVGVAAAMLLIALATIYFVSHQAPRRKAEESVVETPKNPLPLPVSYTHLSGRIEGERVVTGSLLVLPDGTDITLREESRFALERSGDDITLRLDIGEVYIDSPKREHPLYVRTPRSKFAIVGTAFDIRTDAEWTSLSVAHGAVKWDSEVLEEGQSMSVGLPGAKTKSPTIDLSWMTEARRPANLIQNPGFEEDFKHWSLNPDQQVGITIDSRAYAGKKCAQVEFKAKGNYVHYTPASDPIPVKAGTRYRFSGYVKCHEIDAGREGGVYLEIQDARGWKFFNQPTPFYSGTFDWKKFVLEFTIPKETKEVRVVCTKVKNGLPIRGTFRFDELELFEIGR